MELADSLVQINALLQHLRFHVNPPGALRNCFEIIPLCPPVATTTYFLLAFFVKSPCDSAAAISLRGGGRRSRAFVREPDKQRGVVNLLQPLRCPFSPFAAEDASSLLIFNSANRIVATARM